MLELHMRVHNYNIFLHDSAPCHRSKVMTNFLEQKRIQRLEWPGNSLDLDPIKNLWNFMKNKVSEKHPSSLDALQTAIELVWVRVLQFLRWCCVILCDSPRTGCAWRTTPSDVARTSNNRVIMACELYCCLLPRCEALRICRSGFPIATKWCCDQDVKVVRSSAVTQRTCDRCGSL